MPALHGLAAAAVSLLVVLVPTVLAWMVESRSSGPWHAPVGLGAGLWLLIQGARLDAAGASVAWVPLLLGLVPVAVAAFSVRRVLWASERDEPWAGLLPRSVALDCASWWGGYAVGVFGAAGLTYAGPAEPQLLSLVVPLVAVPALGALVALVREAREDPDLLGPRLRSQGVPLLVRRAVGPALWGAGLLLALGAAIVLLAVAASLGDVLRLHRELGAGALGGTLLVLAQLASLPNLALWAVSFLAGPGFQVVEGATTTWSGSRSGLMPLVPALGALPSPGDFPWVTAALVLVPVGVGGVVGSRALRTLARLSSPRTKLTTALTAAVLAAVVLAALDAVGGGSFGAYRLTDVGAPALPLLLALALELSVGAGLAVAWDLRRLRR